MWLPSTRLFPAERLEIGLLCQGLLARQPAAVAERERSETASQGKCRGDHAQAGFDQGGPGDGGRGGSTGELAFRAGQALEQVALPLGGRAGRDRRLNRCRSGEWAGRPRGPAGRSDRGGGEGGCCRD